MSCTAKVQYLEGDYAGMRDALLVLQPSKGGSCAQGKRDAAIRGWRAAEAVFAGRYTPEHPFLRELAAHLRSRVAAR